VDGMLFVYVIQPILIKAFSKLEEKYLKIASYVILGVMGIDFLTVILGYIIK